MVQIDRTADCCDFGFFLQLWHHQKLTNTPLNLHGKHFFLTWFIKTNDFNCHGNIDDCGDEAILFSRIRNQWQQLVWTFRFLRSSWNRITIYVTEMVIIIENKHYVIDWEIKSWLDYPRFSISDLRFKSSDLKVIREYTGI